MVETLLLRIETDRNMRRFYAVRCAPTLFGEVSMVRCWGRIGTRGREIYETFADEQQARAAAVRQIDRKRKRGYSDSDSLFGS